MVPYIIVLIMAVMLSPSPFPFGLGFFFFLAFLASHECVVCRLSCVSFSLVGVSMSCVECVCRVSLVFY